MKRYESRARDKILGKLSTAVNRQKSDQKSISSSSTASTSSRRDGTLTGLKSQSRSRSQSRNQSHSFLLGSDNLSENHLNDKNFKKFHWTWKLRRALIVEDCRTAIRSDALHFKYNLSSVEFVGLTSCINLRILLTTCPHIRRLIFNNVSLLFLSTDSRFSIITLNNLQEIKFYSSFPKITQHEFHLLDWFYKRVRMLSLQSISFEPKSYFHIHTKDSFVNNSSNISSNISRNSAVSTISNSLRSDTHNPHPNQNNPNNPNQNSKRQAFILSNLLLKYADTLKSLEVRRPSSIFIFDENTERLSKIAKLQLDRFSSDMRNEGFEKILSVQKSIQAIHCYYNSQGNGQATPKGFKRLFATIASNVKHIKEILIVKQQQQQPQLGRGSETGLSSQYPYQGNINSLIPELVNHDFKTYEKCVNLTKLNIDVSNSSSTATSHVKSSPSTTTKRPSSAATEQYQYQNQHHHHLGLMEFKTGIRNLDCIPISIRSLILRFDCISDGQMQQFAQHFSKLVNLMFFVMHGNPERPFKLTLDWISLLIELENLMLFEFHFCDFKDMESVSTFVRARPSLYYSKFEATKESVVYWRTKSSSEDSHLNHTNTNSHIT